MEELDLNSVHEDQEVEEDYSDITLRPFELSDIDDFMVWATDDKVSKFCSWETFTCKEAALKHMVDSIIPHPWFRAICLRGRPIGAILVTPFEGYNRCKAEIGYVLASKYWGKGIVTKTVKMVVSLIFVEWPHLERLESLVDINNLGSVKVMEKVGFKKEGVLRKYLILKGKVRDMAIFSILSTEINIENFH